MKSFPIAAGDVSEIISQRVSQFIKENAYDDDTISSIDCFAKKKLDGEKCMATIRMIHGCDMMAVVSDKANTEKGIYGYVRETMVVSDTLQEGFQKKIKILDGFRVVTISVEGNEKHKLQISKSGMTLLSIYLEILNRKENNQQIAHHDKNILPSCDFCSLM